jgi:hypothetical protein
VGEGAIRVQTTVRLEYGDTVKAVAYTSCVDPKTGVMHDSTELPLVVEEQALRVEVDEVSGSPTKRTNKSASPSAPWSSHVTFSPARTLDIL